MTAMPGSDTLRETALLVVDLQVAVVSACHDAVGVMSRTAALVGRARHADVPVVYVQHEEEGLAHGTPGWELAAPLDPRPDEPRVRKRYRDAFAATDLQSLLEGWGVFRLLVAGAQSDFCVRTTAQRAAAAGYDVTLVSDCHTTWDQEYAGVRLSGSAIIAHTNRFFSDLRYPDQILGTATSDTVDLVWQEETGPKVVPETRPPAAQSCV